MKTLITAIVVALSAALTPILPDAIRTPGTVNSDITQANISETICVSGFTATIRPPSSYTTALKKRQLASGYSHNGDKNISHYEEDHLVPLELGGSPNSESNLWPEPYTGQSGARIKDKLENKLHSLVCSGKILLAKAQILIASNWWVAYTQYVLGETVPETQTTPSATPTQQPTASEIPIATPTPASNVPSVSASPLPVASSGPTQLQLVTPGAFCSLASAGTQGRSAAGTIYTCKTSATENRLRWRL